MHTFAQKQKPTQKGRSASPAKSNGAFSGQSRKVDSILHLQRTVGNQAVQRFLRSRTETAIPHNFGRIPVYASARSNIQPKPKTNALGDQACGEYASDGPYGKKLVAHERVHKIHRHHTPELSSRGAGNGSSSPTPSSVPGAAPVTAEDTASGTTTTTSASTTLRWQHVKRHRWDALWFFCGEHPAGFSTTATLRAERFTNPNDVEWFVRQGADKVYAPGGFHGPEITLHSSAGSRRPGDVHIEVQEQMPNGTVNSYLGHLTVRKPHRLRQEWTSDHTTCPDTRLVSSPAFWTEISYRIFDNVHGTIIGATVNERFPGPAVDDQPNNWSGAPLTSTQSWPRTNGTFTDDLYMCGGTPAPVPSGSSQWSDRVYHIPQEFYVGSTTPGRGCRVQAHTLRFYRGFADHENIRTPAP